MGFVPPPLCPKREDFDADPAKYFNELYRWHYGPLIYWLLKYFDKLPVYAYPLYWKIRAMNGRIEKIKKGE